MERGEGGAATIVNKSTFVCCVSSCCALCCCSLLNTPASSPLPHHPRWFYAPIFLPSRYLPPILMSSAMLLPLLSLPDRSQRDRCRCVQVQQDQANYDGSRSLIRWSSVAPCYRR